MKGLVHPSQAHTRRCVHMYTYTRARAWSRSKADVTLPRASFLRASCGWSPPSSPTTERDAATSRTRTSQKKFRRNTHTCVSLLLEANRYNPRIDFPAERESRSEERCAVYFLRPSRRYKSPVEGCSWKSGKWDFRGWFPLVLLDLGCESRREARREVVDRRDYLRFRPNLISCLRHEKLCLCALCRR